MAGGSKAVRSMIILPVSVLLFATGLFLRNLQIMNIAIILFWINNMMLAVEKPSERLFYMAFMGTFFAFILGRSFARMIYEYTNYHTFSTEILIHTNICVYLSLISLFFGYLLCEKVRIKTKRSSLRDLPDNEERYSNMQYTTVRVVSMVLFYSTFPFRVLIALEKAVFVSTSGYAEYYVSYKSRFPYVFVKLSDVCIVAFFIFLSTMPLKKQCRIPVVLYMISAVIGMFGGKRSQLIVPLITIVLYFAVRNTINRGESEWLTRKMVMTLVVVAPFLLAAMYVFNYTRFGHEASAGSFVEKIVGFFDNLGFSVNVISYEKLFENRIPHKLYSIGDTIDYLRENVLTQLFFDFPVYKTQTVEKALHGNNFTQTITYLYSESYYLSGRGFGSSYIAEAYHDFGYIGVVVWSFIYCYVLKNIFSFTNRGIIYNTLAFQALKYVLEAPRTMASAFITEYINVNTWLVISFVFLTARLLKPFFRTRFKNSATLNSTIPTG